MAMATLVCPTTAERDRELLDMSTGIYLYLGNQVFNKKTSSASLQDVSRPIRQQNTESQIE
jgi:hypothetical protein